MTPTTAAARQTCIVNAHKGTENRQDGLECEAEDVNGRFLPQQTLTSTQLTVLRLLILMTMCGCYVYSQDIQNYINDAYEFLRHQWWFQTVYFETVFVVILSFPATALFQVMDKISFFDKYRVEPKGGRMISESLPELVRHSIEYMGPLALLDTFHVKHYYGVDDDVINEKRKNWIQKTRALPEYSPQFGDILLHIFTAIAIYDFIFFIIHYNLHKNASLYRVFHKKHHTHELINAKVTDHQDWRERIAFVLFANGGLKIQGAHPFTRLVFVFVFVGTLIYNHCGYDFPFAHDKIVPWNLMSGSRQHYEHHAIGKRYYQFIFTYIDNTLEWMNKREQDKRKEV